MNEIYKSFNIKNEINELFEIEELNIFENIKIIQSLENINNNNYNLKIDFQINITNFIFEEYLNDILFFFNSNFELLIKNLIIIINEHKDFEKILINILFTKILTNSEKSIFNSYLLFYISKNNEFSLFNVN
jgi:hypothetical protein